MNTPAMPMRAVVRSRYGDADALEVARVERPVPRKDEVLIRVMAAGLDYGQWHLMTGRPYVMRLATGLSRPKQRVLGVDVGRVRALARRHLGHRFHEDAVAHRWPF